MLHHLPSPIWTRLVLAVVCLTALGLRQPTNAAASASNPGFVHERWGVRDGLPVIGINQLIQTRDGYLWMATFDGLVRFDGVRFTIFNTGNSKSLPSNRIRQILEAQDGSMWLLTEQGHALIMRIFP